MSVGLFECVGAYIYCNTHNAQICSLKQLIDDSGTEPFVINSHPHKGANMNKSLNCSAMHYSSIYWTADINFSIKVRKHQNTYIIANARFKLWRYN